MGTEVTDLEQMMKTLSEASKDPSGVTVGDFAKAVQSLQAELKLLETEVDRIGSTVGATFDGGSQPTALVKVENAEEKTPEQAEA